MYNFKGVITAFVISLTSVPLVVTVTNHDILSQPLIMMSIGFSLLLFVSVAVIMFIPPNSKPNDEYLEGRGVVYYTCCLFLWASMADLTIQSRHLQLFGLKGNRNYFINGELYLSIPFGITTQLWNAICNAVLYLIMIFQIDSRIDCRSTAMYWCGSILTSQFVVLIGAFTGSFSDKLEYPVWMNVVFVVVPACVFCKFLLKPIYVPTKSIKIPNCLPFDKALCLLLLFLSMFGTVRGLGALGSNFPLIKSYVDNFEPYIKEPSKFGSTWALYTAFYGVPFNLVAIYALLRPGCAWMLNWSVFYASGMLQGTFTYMSYSWYSISDPNYRIPKQSFSYVVFLNVLLVIVAHLLMVRCLSRSEYFTYAKIEKKLSKKL